MNYENENKHILIYLRMSKYKGKKKSIYLNTHIKQQLYACRLNKHGISRLEPCDLKRHGLDHTCNIACSQSTSS